jgi:very-short-patch-repair endonuclease
MEKPSPKVMAECVLPATFLSLRGLADLGVSRSDVSRLLAAGQLERLRNGRYVRPDIHHELRRAGRIGGRLDCLSLLAVLGVFVSHNANLHLQVSNGASRLPARPTGTVVHWRRTAAGSDALAADLIEALAQSVRCQEPRDAIATLDSAWHHRLVDEADIAAVFARLPRRFRRLRALLDRRSESGPETIMRLMLRGLGCEVRVQVSILGVGRVDFIVDGWLIVECDSRAHHEGWKTQKRDRARDIAAAELGYTTIRPIAEDILYRREETLASMKAVLAHHRTPGAQNSARSSRRAAKSAR